MASDGAAPEELARENEFLRARVGELERTAAELRRRCEEFDTTLRRRTHSLSERVKELRCLYEARQLQSDPDKSVDEVIQAIADLIPGGLQQPHQACARITCDGRCFATQGFTEAQRRLSADIRVAGRRTGAVEVFYRSPAGEGGREAFLAEEKQLVEALADGIAHFLQRKRTTDALADSEHRFSVFMDNLPAGVFIRDARCRMLYANRCLEEILRGVDWLGKTAAEIFPGEIGQRMLDDDRAAPAAGHSVRAEAIPHADGLLHTYRTRRFRIPSGLDGEALLGGIAVDITELEQARLRLEMAVARSGAAVWEIRFRPQDPPGTIPDEVYLSPEMKALAGYADGEMPNSLGAWLERIVPEDLDRLHHASREHVEGHTPAYEVQYRVRHKDGTIRWLSARGRIERDAEGRPLRWAGLAWDVTEHVRAERAVQESEERFRAIFDTARDGILLADAQSKTFRMANRAMCEMLGYSREELCGLGVADIHPPRDLPGVVEAFERQLRGEISVAADIPVRRRDGSVFLADVNSTPVSLGGQSYLLGIFRDITERRQLEQQFRQSQKMEAVGRLAGGVAHDFNNLLTGISGYTGFAMQALPEGSPAREDLAHVGALAERAAGLTRQLLAFSRKQPLRMEAVDLNALVGSLAKMLGRLLGEDVAVAFRPAAALGAVRADAGQIEQVLMNLVVNARDAMPTGGELTIATANVELDEEYARNRPDVQPGPYVLLSVADSGCGMDAETRRQVFEPFFTTKEMGRGTGLGLATVYGIVKQHGGNIWVYSELGKGTVFKIHLPRMEGVAPAAASAPAEAIPRGSETVLVLEDDPAVRDIAARFLEALGYEVCRAGAPAEARKVLAGRPGGVDLLLTDVILPECSGPQFRDELRADHPALRVVYMSGYAPEAVARYRAPADEAILVQKPFAPSDLARAVRAALDR